MKKLLFVACCFSAFLIIVSIIFKPTIQNSSSLSPIEMPLVENDPYLAFADGDVPIEERGIEVRKWLSAGVKVDVGLSSGSGTIIYYNNEDGYAYVQSCGHLWNGSMSAANRRKLNCKIITWYHNDKKLDKQRKYDAEVLYYNNGKGYDCSLIRFKPDWIPDYFPIAPEEFQYEKDMNLHSVGCDDAKEVAHYKVRFIGIMSGNPSLITTGNSPRRGRSGGGLMTDEFFVGVCWGTSDYSGEGNGFFTSIGIVRELNEKNGFGWINEAGSWLRRIPIVDRNNPQGKYPASYIPMPNRSQ